MKLTIDKIKNETEIGGITPNEKLLTLTGIIEIDNIIEDKGVFLIFGNIKKDQEEKDLVFIAKSEEKKNEIINYIQEEKRISVQSYENDDDELIVVKMSI